MKWSTIKDAEFVGREAYLHKRDQAPAAVLCTLTVDDNTSKSGVKRHAQARADPARTAASLVDEGPPVSDERRLRAIRGHLLMSYLPPAQAVERERLLVEYFGERYPVTVAIAGATSLFDPENERIRAERSMRILALVKRVPRPRRRADG